MLSKKRVINKLKNFKIGEVSTVDAGANLFSEVLITKRAEGDDLVATLDDFQGWIAKADLDPETSASDAFEQFAEQVSKASPMPGEMHHDKPMGSDRKCKSCGHEIPEGSPKCLNCKRKVSKALPPSRKIKLKRPKSKEEDTEEPSDVAPKKLPTDDDAEKDDSNPFTDDEEVDEDEEEASNPFSDEGEEDEEEGPVAEGEELEDEDFDPTDVQLPSDLPAEVGEYIGNLEALIEHLEEKMRDQEQMTLSKADDTKPQPGKEDLDFLQGIAKSLNAGEEVEYSDLTKAMGQMIGVVKGYEAQTKAAEERAEQATTVAKAERDIRVTAEMIEIVKSWKALPLDASEFSLVLKRIKESVPEEDFAALTKAFGQASEAAQMAQEFGDDTGLFAEVGKGGGASNTDSTDPLEQEVAKRMADDSKLSRPQAVAKVLDEKPELYDKTRR